MNIFYTSSCPYRCAEFLDDKRVVKMAVETAQMLSNAFGGPYRASHMNHPCSVWTRESRENAQWMICHLDALCKEYTKTYHKIHKCQQLVSEFSLNLSKLPSNGTSSHSEPPNCTLYKSISVKNAYQMYLLTKWAMYDKRKPTKYKKCINTSIQISSISSNMVGNRLWTRQLVLNQLPQSPDRS